MKRLISDKRSYCLVTIMGSESLGIIMVDRTGSRGCMEHQSRVPDAGAGMMSADVAMWDGISLWPV